jgi:hypothetical protein
VANTIKCSLFFNELYSLNYLKEAYDLTILSPELQDPFHPDFVKAVSFWAIFFIVLHLSFERLARLLLGKTYDELKPAKKKDLATYVISTCHHLVVVPYVSYFVTKDILTHFSNPQPFEPSHMDPIYSNFGVISFSVGFFFGDGIAFYIPEAFNTGSFVYLLHHLFSIIMLTTTKSFHGDTLQAIPQMFLVEMSTAFFNIAWICRCLSNGRIPQQVISALEGAFAITFFIFRIINGTFFLSLVGVDLWEQSKLFFVAFIAMLILQYYWFYKILLSVFGGSRKKVE